MNPGIFYFYHYMTDRPPCNVGFLKLNAQFSSCMAELHIRNIPVSQGDTLKLGIFYPEDEHLTAISLSDIVAKTNAVFAKCDIPETVLMQHTLSEFGGFFLILPDGSMIAATAPGITFTPGMLHFETKSKTEPPRTEDTPAVPFPEPVKEEAPALFAAPIKEKPAAMPLAENEPADSALADEISPTNDKTPSMDDTTSSPTNETPCADCNVSSMDTMNNPVPRQTIRKIKRQELRILPRKYWNLSNNSFLMHGYYNYNHLLLVEKDGYYLVGVPGVYSTREAHAANLFGFPAFTDEYNSKMELTGEEQNNYGTFGYWCCEIHV